MRNSPGTSERIGPIGEARSISFQTATLVFDDPFHISVQDREVDGEVRWQTIGMVNGVHVLLVAHIMEEEGGLIRILSARKATRQERSIYAQGV